MAFSGLGKVQSVETLRSQALTMFYGRRDGIDPTEFHVGAKDVRVPIENITTTAASTLRNFGVSCLTATANSSAAYTLEAPNPGVNKRISQLSSSTLGYVISAGSSVYFVSTLGTSQISVLLAGQGQCVDLFAISTSAWQCTNAITTANGMTMTTATS